MVSPQFLIPQFTFFKSFMQRMAERGLHWSSDQSTPHGFVGIALLMQICDRVTVYGFEEPSSGGGRTPYHYYDKIEPVDPHAADVEFAVLRALDRLGVIRLCSGDRRQECLEEDRVSFQLA